MRIIHWFMWNIARIWHTLLRVFLSVHDEWAPGLTTSEKASWDAYKRQRERQKTGRPTSRVAIPVGPPRVKAPEPAKPESTETDPGTPAPVPEAAPASESE